MGHGTGPAWQVRDSARNSLLAQLKILIYKEEQKHCNKKDMYRVLLLLFDRELAHDRVEVHTRDLPSISWTCKRHLNVFFETIRKRIRDFQRSDTEGSALLARLFVHIATVLANPSLNELDQQQFDDPQRIYHAKNRTDEVPLEPLRS